MTRQDIERKYRVSDGVIRSPGKFEGEPIYAPYFWDLVLNGDGDTRYPQCQHGENDECDCSPVDYFHVDSGDREQFPELKDVSDVYLWEDSQGYVILKTTADAVRAYWGLPADAAV